jgi:glycosyltransferase involved in cell wall biosynthesis
MTAPLVSVILPSYNHAPYVAEAIASVLAQEGVAFELLVEDDGSTDGTADVIRKVRDPRVKFWPKARNEGACATHNNLVRRAKGEFVALINSDDMWATKDKLARQVQLMRERPDVAACFGRATFVGADGNPVPQEKLFYGSVFEQDNRSRGQWLRHFFVNSNCICHPSMLIRRAVYDEVGPYDNRLRQVPDFDMWIRVVKRHEIFIFPEPLVKFRLVEGANASAPTPANMNRILNEHYLVFRTFFDGVDRATLLDGFSDLLLNPEPREGAEVEVEKALLYFRVGGSMGPLMRTIGLTAVYEMLADADCRAVLADYDIDDKWLHAELGESTPFIRHAPAAQPAASSPAQAAPPRKPGPLMRYLSFLRR